MEKIRNFPTMFFALVMGISGFTMAFEKLNIMFNISNLTFLFLKYAATAIFLLIFFLYVSKVFFNINGFKKEFSHPIKINFFAAFIISLLLLSILWRGSFLHYILYYTGTILLSFFTLYIINFWIKNQMSLNTLNPAWFIPIVGNLIVIVACENNQPYLWYYFSVGLFFYVVLFCIIFYKLIFHAALSAKFAPTYFILLAPPAIAFLDYTKLINGYDAFSYILLSLTLFFSLLIIFMLKSFLNLKFYLSWWAFTFPLAAITLAFLTASNLDKFFLYIGITSFIALSLLITIVSYFTILAILKGEICVEEVA